MNTRRSLRNPSNNSQNNSVADGNKNVINQEIAKPENKLENEDPSSDFSSSDSDDNISVNKKRTKRKYTSINDGSSSDSSVGNYLKAPSEIDLNSFSFTSSAKTQNPDLNYKQNNFGGIERLSESEDSENEFSTNQNTATQSNINNSQNNNKTKVNFSQLRDYNQKLEETKRCVEKYETNKNIKTDKPDIKQLLSLGEKNESQPSFGSTYSDFDTDDDDELDDWEEIENKNEDKLKIPKEGVQITLQLPNTVQKKSKSVDLMAIIKRRINRIKKDNQVYVHKVHLLCWIAHGNFVNSVLNNEILLSQALSLLPSEKCYPPKHADISYVEQIVKWYRKLMKLPDLTANNDQESLLESLLNQIIKKQAISKRDFIFIFIILLRSLGLQCRLVLSYQGIPLRPHSSELCSLSTTRENPETTSSTKASTSKTLNKSKSTKESKKNSSSKSKTSNKSSKSNKKNDLDSLKISQLDGADDDLPSSSKKETKRKGLKSKLNKNLNETSSLDFYPSKKVKDSKSLKQESVPEDDFKSKKSSLRNNSKKDNNKSASGTSKNKEELNNNTKKTEVKASSSTSNKNDKNSTAKETTSRKRKSTEIVLNKESDSSNAESIKPKIRKTSEKKSSSRISSTSKEIKPSTRTSSRSKEIKPTPKRKLNVANDIVNIIKGEITEKRHERKSKLVKKLVRKNADSDYDSDYFPDEPEEKERKFIENVESDNDFKFKINKNVRSKKQRGDGIDTRVFSSDEEIEEIKKMGNDVWLEIFVEEEEKWISVDLIKGQVHCVSELYSRATQPVSYIVAWNNNLTIKDVTVRYCINWNTVTRKLRVDSDWWNETLKPFQGKETIRDKEEDEDLARQQLDRPLPTTINEYKNHPLYVLKRHLLKFEGIYPPDAVTLGFVRNEAVYARECVHTLHSREIWVKHAKVVKLGEKPYKIVKARPKYDRLTGKMISDLPLELFGIWQVQDYEPPTAENGIVPRNAYGNVELFKACMLPKKTVHLQLPGLNKIARKLQIDCAPAVIGFDFHSGWSHPTFDGFVVCEEFKDILIAAWEEDQAESAKRELDKYEKRVWGNWRKLIKAVLIRERLKARYDFGKSEESSEKKKSGQLCLKKRKVCSDAESDGE